MIGRLLVLTETKHSLKKSYWKVVMYFVLLLAVSVVIIPFSPKMPTPSLDGSWALGLNQAVAQGLSFGKQIIFTLGPYAAIYTQLYHPATDALMMAGAGFIALFYFLACVLLFQGRTSKYLAVFSIVLLSMTYSRDVVFYSYPLLLALVIHRYLFTTKDMQKQLPNILIFLFAPLGLLCLIKGSFIPWCFAVMGGTAVSFYWYEDYRSSVLSGLMVLVSMVSWWLLSGQSLSNLPAFLTSSLKLVFSFTAAMADFRTEDASQSREILVYLFAVTVLLLTLIGTQKREKTGCFYLAFFFATFLFLSFKASFSRHLGHAYIASTALLFAGFLLLSFLRLRHALPPLLLSFASAFFINHHYTHVSLVYNGISSLKSAWHGLSSRFLYPRNLGDNYRVLMGYYANKVPFPLFEGTTDIYSYGQTYLIASGNHWIPRPVFQSYSVFNQEFAEKNRIHLSGLNRPDTILFKLEPIDDRMPSLADGISWVELFEHYEWINSIKGYLVLRAQKAKSLKVGAFKQTVRSSLNKEIVVPQGARVFMQVHVQASLLGRWINFLYKSRPLYLEIRLKNGGFKRYRFIAEMAESGFLLSPLIEHTLDFQHFIGKNPSIERKKVDSILIRSKHADSWAWRSQLRITFWVG